MIKTYLQLFLCSIGCILLCFSANAQDSITKRENNQNLEINYTVNQTTFNFRSNKFIDFKSVGTIIFPDSTDAVLMEIHGDKKIEAELKVTKDDYRLIFIHEGCLDEYYKNEEDWMAHFFKNIINSQKSTTDIKVDKSGNSGESIDTSNENAPIDVFLNTLKSIVLENDRSELLNTRIKKGCDIKEQKKIIGFIFSNFQIEQNKMDLLVLLLDQPSYSKENNEFVMAFVDQFAIESNKVLILKKLLK
jgi:hypothetical protein